MEHGFYHPDRGYWQAIDGDPESLLPSYPEGTIEVPLKPSAGHEWRGGAWVAVAPPAPTVDDYTSAIVALLDTTAQSRRYDGALSISTYVTSTHADWAAEAAAFVAWRDVVWAYAYAELDKVLNGQRTQPTVAEMLAELPAMVWP